MPKTCKSKIRSYRHTTNYYRVLKKIRKNTSNERENVSKSLDNPKETPCVDVPNSQCAVCYGLYFPAARLISKLLFTL